MEAYYGLYSLLVSAWIIADAPSHNVSRWWALWTFFLPFVTPYYFIKTRPARKGYFKCIGIWLLCAGITFGVGRAIEMRNEHTTANPPKESSNRTTPWVTFVSEDKQFSVKFPTEPKQSSQIGNTSAGRVEVIMYTASRDDITYVAGYADYPPGTFDGMTADRILDNVRDAAAENIHGRILTELIISKGKYPGREITVKVEPDRFITSQSILKGNRVYQLALTCKGEKLLDSQRRNFFDSFTILQ